MREFEFFKLETKMRPRRSETFTLFRPRRDMFRLRNRDTWDVPNFKLSMITHWVVQILLNSEWIGACVMVHTWQKLKKYKYRVCTTTEADSTNEKTANFSVNLCSLGYIYALTCRFKACRLPLKLISYCRHRSREMIFGSNMFDSRGSVSNLIAAIWYRFSAKGGWFRLEKKAEMLNEAKCLRSRLMPRARDLGQGRGQMQKY